MSSYIQSEPQLANSELETNIELTEEERVIPVLKRQKEPFNSQGWFKQTHMGVYPLFFKSLNAFFVGGTALTLANFFLVQAPNLVERKIATKFHKNLSTPGYTVILKQLKNNILWYGTVSVLVMMTDHFMTKLVRNMTNRWRDDDLKVNMLIQMTTVPLYTFAFVNKWWTIHGILLGQLIAQIKTQGKKEQMSPSSLKNWVINDQGQIKQGADLTGTRFYGL